MLQPIDNRGGLQSAWRALLDQASKLYTPLATREVW